MYFIYQLCIILHVLSILASGLSRSKGATVQQPGTALFLCYAATVVAIVAWVYLPEPKGIVESLAEDGKPEPRFGIPGQRPCEHDEVAAVEDA